MIDKSIKLSEVIGYGLGVLGIILLFVVLYTWIKTPGDRWHSDTEYTECLKIILNHPEATIADAEIMCKDTRKGK
jgi:hypothetical protein